MFTSSLWPARLAPSPPSPPRPPRLASPAPPPRLAHRPTRPHSPARPHGLLPGANQMWGGFALPNALTHWACVARVRDCFPVWRCEGRYTLGGTGRGVTAPNGLYFVRLLDRRHLLPRSYLAFSQLLTTCLGDHLPCTTSSQCFLPRDSNRCGDTVALVTSVGDALPVA